MGNPWPFGTRNLDWMRILSGASPWLCKENRTLDTPDGARLMSSLALAYFDRQSWNCNLSGLVTVGHCAFSPSIVMLMFVKKCLYKIFYNDVEYFASAPSLFKHISQGQVTILIICPSRKEHGLAVDNFQQVWGGDSIGNTSKIIKTCSVCVFVFSGHMT